MILYMALGNGRNALALNFKMKLFTKNVILQKKKKTNLNLKSCTNNKAFFGRTIRNVI